MSELHCSTDGVTFTEEQNNTLIDLMAEDRFYEAHLFTKDILCASEGNDASPEDVHNCGDVPVITELPPLPLRTEHYDDFVAKAETHLKGWDLFRSQLIALSQWMCELAVNVKGVADKAAEEAAEKAATGYIERAHAIDSEFVHLNVRNMKHDITLPANTNGSVVGPINTNGHTLKAGAGTRLVIL